MLRVSRAVQGDDHGLAGRALLPAREIRGGFAAVIRSPRAPSEGVKHLGAVAPTPKGGLSMGTWSLHAFGNDTAADFALDLRDTEGFGLLQSALDEVINADEYLEAPEADRGVAAAAVVALLNGQAVAGEQDGDLDAWVKRQSIKPSPALLSQAQAVIERVLAEESELAELWAESGEYEAWREGLLELKASLGR